MLSDSSVCDIGCEDVFDMKFLERLLLAFWAPVIIEEIERQERVKQKCKDGTLSIFDLL